MLIFVVVWCGTLVGVFSVMWSELLMTFAISCPMWSSVYECQRVVCGMFEMYCMQCCMSVPAVLECVDVMSRGGIYMSSIVICLALLMCTLTI